ncbi:hypothetical protein EGT74_11465 [Chitinophaga lutea]|uniref:Uncharacterized protein n=1 Tax=Chitinophaga lutea TaxID=2488634 RepID=A0A3N4PZB6_9BACT|nr:hypothetical protein EGT74_11465 [Chitinophaga lutea]
MRLFLFINPSGGRKTFLAVKTRRRRGWRKYKTAHAPRHPYAGKINSRPAGKLWLQSLEVEVQRLQFVVRIFTGHFPGHVFILHLAPVRGFAGTHHRHEFRHAPFAEVAGGCNVADGRTAGNGALAALQAGFMTAGARHRQVLPVCRRYGLFDPRGGFKRMVDFFGRDQRKFIQTRQNSAQRAQRRSGHFVIHRRH